MSKYPIVLDLIMGANTTFNNTLYFSFIIMATSFFMEKPRVLSENNQSDTRNLQALSHNVILKKIKVTNECSDVVKSRQRAIFAGYCPFLGGYFSMSNKKNVTEKSIFQYYINCCIV